MSVEGKGNPTILTFSLVSDSIGFKVNIGEASVVP